MAEQSQIPKGQQDDGDGRELAHPWLREDP
jgi:hypothetical protein